MIYAVVKALLSGAIVATVSETARRSPVLGALVASLPIVSVLSMIWLWRDTHDTAQMASYVQSIFWYFLPSLPMFLVMPALLRTGFGFLAALGLSCAMTVLLYLAMTAILSRLGITI